MTRTNRKKMQDAEFSFETEEREVAFVKSDIKNGEGKWYIYSSDGTKIAETSSRENAFVIARQNDFSPCSVH
ncbi:MAG: DUF1150 family protein [Alphaproteobacteria bacterium]